MNEAPSKILLIVAPYPGFARDWAWSVGLSSALTLGRARIVTRPGQLRGWRAGTLFHVVGSDQMDGKQREALAAAIKIYSDKGQLHWAKPEDVTAMLEEEQA